MNAFEASGWLIATAARQILNKVAMLNPRNQGFNRSDGPRLFSGTRELGRAYPAASSYPSGHAFGEFLLFGLIFLFAPLVISSRAAVVGTRALCVSVIVLGGIERVANGRHWASDVLGAYLLALLFVSVAWWLSRSSVTGR